MGYGIQGYIGLAKESSWGVAVAATDYFEALSESLKEEIDRFDVRNIYAGFHEADDVAGLHRITGDIVLAGQPVALGHILKAAMNTESGSVVLSGFLWTTRFISTKSEFAAGVPSQPYTLEVFRDITSAHRYTGCVLNQLTLALAPNQDLRATASWIGQAGVLLAKTSPTFPGSSTEPFTFDTASVQLAGSATARIEAFQISVDNQLEGIPALNNSTTIARLYRRGPQLIRISGSIDFPDVAEFLDFKNQTERALSLNLFKSQSFSLLIDVPKFVYRAFPTGTSGRGRNLVSFEGQARYLSTSATAVDFRLTTTKSNW